jgi:endonuclease/exonuclease/phosphatase family metal-dependent hydrolase
MQDLVDLVKQLPSPFLLLGDFNAHSDLWGDQSLDRFGIEVENFLDISNLCLLKDGSTTYFHGPSGSQTAIDLSICGPSLIQDLDWKVHSDLCGSDHFPIILKIQLPSAPRNQPR